MPLKIAVVVEGDGDDEAILTLLTRIWQDHLHGDYLIPSIVIRHPQGTLMKEEGLKKAIELAKRKLDTKKIEEAPQLILILIDAERGGCPKEMAPELLKWGKEQRSDADIVCVMPNPIFETWFVASAESLRGKHGIPDDFPVIEDPEGKRKGKKGIKDCLKNYKETQDQKKFASEIDLAICYKRSRSFRKSCDELKSRIPKEDSAPEQTESTNPTDQP